MAYSMLSDVALPRDPTISGHAATKNYVDLQDALYQTYSTTAPASPILGGLWTDTTASPRLYLKQWNGSSWVTIADTNTLTATADFVNVNGDTMTGYLVLHADPDANMKAATKQYVDTRAFQTIDLTAGAGLTGGGTLAANRTFTVGAGTGITVNTDDVAVNRTVVDTWYAAAAHNHDSTYLKLIGGTLTGPLVLNANPSAALEAATKQYVDITSQGFTFKNAVRVVAATNTALTGLLTIDGVTLATGNRVLVAGNTTASENGIWVAASGAWTRAVDADASGELVDGTLVPVAQGTTYADTQFICTATGADPWVPGTSTSTWTRYSGLQDLVAGNGLTKTGNQIDVAPGSGISVAGDVVAVDSTVERNTNKGAASGYASLDGTTKVPIAQIPTGTTGTTVSLGNHTHSGYAASTTTMTAGAGLTGGGDLSTNRTFDVVALSTGGLQVNADDIQIKLNGTTLQTNASGLSVLSAPKWSTARTISISGAVTGSASVDGTGDVTISTTGSGGAATRYSQTISGGSTSETITHSLGTKDVVVTLYEVSTGNTVGCDVSRPTVNTVTLGFAVAPAAGAYRVVVV